MLEWRTMVLAAVGAIAIVGSGTAGWAIWELHMVETKMADALEAPTGLTTDEVREIARQEAAGDRQKQFKQIDSYDIDGLKSRVDEQEERSRSVDSRLGDMDVRMVKVEGRLDVHDIY